MDSGFDEESPESNSVATRKEAEDLETARVSTPKEGCVGEDVGSGAASQGSGTTHTPVEPEGEDVKRPVVPPMEKESATPRDDREEMEATENPVAGRARKKAAVLIPPSSIVLRRRGGDGTVLATSHTDTVFPEGGDHQ